MINCLGLSWVVLLPLEDRVRLRVLPCHRQSVGLKMPLRHHPWLGEKDVLCPGDGAMLLVLRCEEDSPSESWEVTRLPIGRTYTGWKTERPYAQRFTAKLLLRLRPSCTVRMGSEWIRSKARPVGGPGGFNRRFSILPDSGKRKFNHCDTSD